MGEQGNPASSNDDLRDEVVDHLTTVRGELRRAWGERMTAEGLLSEEEVEQHASMIYDPYVEYLVRAERDGIEAYSTRIAEKAISTRMTTQQILEGILAARGLHEQGLLERFRAQPARMSAALELYRSMADGIFSASALRLLEERERAAAEDHREALLELSTPVLQLRERLLLLPIIGVIDTHRARTLTEQLLRAIRDNRARAVVIDITGVAAVDSAVANHLLQTVEAARLMGATVIVTGLAAEVAHTLVTLGVDLSALRTVGDLQGGIDEADKLLGYEVIHHSDPSTRRDGV